MESCFYFALDHSLSASIIIVLFIVEGNTVSVNMSTETSIVTVAIVFS